MEQVEPPAPWELSLSVTIGGLMAVGFATGTTRFLVLSLQGRGLFDGLTGERLSCDENLSDEDYDPFRLIGRGIGPIRGEEVRMSGVYGGGLTRVTSDGWWVESCGLEWPEQTIILARPSSTGEEYFRLRSEIEIVALGFSECGRCLVIAGDYGSLSIYRRPLA
ncbi:MAG: hypothetical protein R3F20_13680 [Planctomycetota bacterium]